MNKNRPQYKHGLYKHPLNYIWAGIRQRCNNQNSPVYHRYGGRGIKICDEWSYFKTFYDWCILNGWKEGMQIDRYPDNDGPYSPSNCRITTPKLNSNNRSDNVKIELNGEVIPLSMACDKYGLKLERVRQYMNRDKHTFQEAIKHYGKI